MGLAPIRMSAHVDGMRVRYWTAGSGAPLVLVHGLAGSQRWWHRSVELLARRRRVLLVDLPGFGGMRAQRFRLADAHGWLGAWLRTLRLGTVDLVGHSMGGLVATRLAASDPSVVRRLVLVAPAGVPSRDRVIGYTLPLAAAAARRPVSFLATLAADAARCGIRTLWHAARDVVRADVRAELSEIQAPTLLVWGERDPLVPPRVAALFRDSIPRARLAVLPAAGHMPMVEQPELFAELVQRFLDAPAA